MFAGIHRTLFCVVLLFLAAAHPAPTLAQDGADSDPPAVAEPAAGAPANPDAAKEKPKTAAEMVDGAVGEWLVGPLYTVLFFDFWSGDVKDEAGNVIREGWAGTSIPFVVVWLMAGAIFLTLYMGFINVRAFWHAIRVTKGDYDNPEDKGEVSHFQALASALSATVGLGNIAGVAIAVGLGGPGAIFWMVVAGLFGMTSKMTECTLAQVYRKIEPDGRVSGGPMRYLRDGLTGMGFAPLGITLSIMFAVLCIGGSFGGGCAFQVNQSMNLLWGQVEVVAGVTPDDLAAMPKVQAEELAMKYEAYKEYFKWFYGFTMAALVGIVIIGGIKRIASAAERIVPLMCGLYVLCAITILVMNFNLIPETIAKIVSEAFQPVAVGGGIVGVMVQGIRRAAFSNEAGTGSAAIAHSAARTEYPVREGIVALLEPFIDTVVICSMTGLVIVITGVYADPANKALIDDNQGAQLTNLAFAGQVSWFPWLLTVAVVLFAYSTMLSWSYYGERCFTFLFGQRFSLAYRILFLCVVVLGAVVAAPNVLDFSDLMILSMALPNMLGLVLMSSHVRKRLGDYWQKYKSGEMKTYN